jgi:hypothetical protein
MNLPPGPIYLARRLPRLLLLPIFVYLGAARLFPQTSSAVLVLLSVLSVPAALTAAVHYKDYVNQRRAAALGAVLPPRIRSKWPGGFSTLKTMVQSFQMGTPGSFRLSPLLRFDFETDQVVFPHNGFRNTDTP